MPRKSTTPSPEPQERGEVRETLQRINPENQFTIIDLFSGAGGMTCGFWQKGFQVSAAVDSQVGKPSEVVPCNDTYELNFGIRPHDFDMHTLSATHFRDEVVRVPRGELTVLISCPPCTGYSQKRHENAASDDARNELVAKTGAFVDAFLPEFLVMENVPEMLKGRYAHHWFRLLRKLRSLKYTVWADILDFSALGLPQRRKRALVIARRNRREVPDLRARMEHAPQPLHVGPALAAHDLPLAVENGQETVDPVHAYSRVGGKSRHVLDRCILIRDRGRGRWSGIDLAELLPEQEALLTERIRTALRTGDRSTYPDCYGTIRPDDLSPTLIRQCGDIGTGSWFHWAEDRMLTAREMAILQGFPYQRTEVGTPFYRFAGSLSKVYQQIGNAVPPLVSRIIAEEILQLLNGGRGLGPRKIPRYPWLRLKPSEKGGVESGRKDTRRAEPEHGSGQVPEHKA